ncbi:GYD domain-containing protein [Mesorhizobium sp. LjNodule214]
MPLFIVTGSYTAAAMKGMIANPSDREAATKSIVDASGGKLISYYLTTGDNDFLMIVEGANGLDMIAPLMVAGASGTVSNLKTVQAYTSAEFMAAQKKAGQIASSFKPAA